MTRQAINYFVFLFFAEARHFFTSRILLAEPRNFTD